MKLKSFGCSFIYGTELADAGLNITIAAGSYLTWPALIAKQFGYKYFSYARPGSGNLQIMERVLNQAVDSEPTLYVIGWTWIDRFDYINPAGSKWPGTPWATITPSDDTELTKNYYQNLHSEYRDKLATLMAIKLTIDILKEKNHPFIMTYMDDLIFDTQWHTTPAVIELQNYIKPHMTQFDNMSFLDWSQLHNFPIGVGQHPLEEAHEAAARYMMLTLNTDLNNASGGLNSL